MNTFWKIAATLTLGFILLVTGVASALLTIGVIHVTLYDGSKAGMEARIPIAILFALQGITFVVVLMKAGCSMDKNINGEKP